MNTEGIESSSPSSHESKVHAQADSGRARELLLITPERSRQFDLLLHLISNLHHPIVLCGPQGIGKTKILNSLQLGKLAGWTVCYLEATPHMTFEYIEEALETGLGEQFSPQKDKDPSRRLVGRLKQLGIDQRNLVLLLDDAGRLEPGVLTQVYQYAVANPALRVVFAMTPDCLHVKTSTDPVVDDCHFVEIPPLTEEQCAEFLKNLSGSSDVAVAYTAVTPEFVHTVYSESHGIPGKVLAVLPEVTKTTKAPKSTATAAYIGLAIVAATAVGISLWGGADKALEEQRGTVRREIVLTEKPDKTTEGTSSTMQSPATPDGQSEPTRTPPSTSTAEGVANDLQLGEHPGAGEGAPQDSGAAEADESAAIDSVTSSELESLERYVPSPADVASAGTAPASQPAAAGGMTPAPGLQPPPTVTPGSPDAAQQSSTEITATSGLKGPDWLLAQDPAHFTLQIMAVSNASALTKVSRQYSHLENLAYFKTVHNGKPLFPVLFGVFPSMDVAVAAKRKLPPALGGAWARRLKHVHNEIRSHRQ